MNLEQLLRLREGVKKKVYKDSRGKPTVGIGHLVLPEDKLQVGDTITEQQVSAFFKIDSAKAVAAAKSQAGKAGIRDRDFLVYLGSVNFQLGTKWIRIFRKTWKLIMEKNYTEAAAALDGTKWAKQTPKRVKDFKGALARLAAASGGGEAK